MSENLNQGGIVLGMDRRLKKLYYNGDDTHTLCIGATRTGKSRTVVLPSIAVQALAGESMVCSDPKGELYLYTYPFLKELGYDVIALDFKNPQKSTRYNLLQTIIDAVERKELSKANKNVFDLVESLVGEAKGERIWNDGEKSIIASTILAVVYDNQKSPQYQNLTNVYHFISNMCKMGKTMPLDKYIASLPADHPARALIAASEVAPSKTRGSFYTAALATLRLFTDVNIYNITKQSDFYLQDIGAKKTAIFLILPDDNTTYYSIATLFVHQMYTALVEQADRRGGRLQQSVNFNLDEFGNFAKIPDFSSKLTVGGSRGIRFNLFIQDIGQLEREDKYGRNDTRTILGNCTTWIYLYSDDPETRKLLSEKLGEYTCMSNSQSSSYQSGSFGSRGSESASCNLISRKLLTPDEIGRLQRPYQIVTSRDYPAMMQMPDLSKTVFNEMFGLGDREHNRLVRIQREQARPVINNDSKVELWRIWDRYTCDENEPGENTIPHFLDGANKKGKEVLYRE